MSEGLMTPEARLRIQGPLGGSSHASATAPARDLASQAEQAIGRTVNWLLSAQNREGYWWAELEADTTLESDYILYLHILGQLNSPKVPKLAKYIRKAPNSDGAPAFFHGEPARLNAQA